MLYEKDSDNDLMETLIMINYEYLRPIKAKYLKRREEAEFPKIEVGFQTFNNSIILPLKKNKQGELLFGRGG